MIPKNVTNVGLLTLAMLCLSTGTQTLLAGLDKELALMELLVGMIFIIVREVAKKYFGEDL